MSSRTAIFDEFGRDLSLKKSDKNIDLDYLNQQAAKNFIEELYKKFKGMSWSEITFAIEDEEEEEEQKIQHEKNKNNDKERLKMYKAGNYELEEGEILE